jgi:hypothetical protein
MKRYCQLNHPLEMASEVAVVRGFAPHVFKGLMGVEEAPGVEKCQAASPGILLHWFQSIWAREDSVSYDFPYLTLTEPSGKLYLFCLVIVTDTNRSSYVRIALECELLSLDLRHAGQQSFIGAPLLLRGTTIRRGR